MNGVSASNYLEFLTFDKVRTAFTTVSKDLSSLGISASDIKFIRSLQQKKFRKEYGMFVVEGVKPVRELLHSDVGYNSIYSTEELDFLPSDRIPISEKELQRISGLKSPNKILATVRIPKAVPISWNDRVVILLDGITDPGNMGTIIRTAKWFGVSDIICSNDCVDAFDRKVVQSTMGALFHVSLQYMDALSAVKLAKERNYEVVGTSMEGTSIYRKKFSSRTLLIIGSESHGIRTEVRDACDELCSIPNLEAEQKIESLNAGIATAVMLSELTRNVQA